MVFANKNLTSAIRTCPQRPSFFFLHCQLSGTKFPPPHPQLSLNKPTTFQELQAHTLTTPISTPCFPPIHRYMSTLLPIRPTLSHNSCMPTHINVTPLPNTTLQQRVELLTSSDLVVQRVLVERAHIAREHQNINDWGHFAPQERRNTAFAVKESLYPPHFRNILSLLLLVVLSWYSSFSPLLFRFFSPFLLIFTFTFI